MATAEAKPNRAIDVDAVAEPLRQARHPARVCAWLAPGDGERSVVELAAEYRREAVALKDRLAVAEDRAGEYRSAPAE